LTHSHLCFERAVKKDLSVILTLTAYLTNASGSWLTYHSSTVQQRLQSVGEALRRGASPRGVLEGTRCSRERAFGNLAHRSTSFPLHLGIRPRCIRRLCPSARRAAVMILAALEPGEPPFALSARASACRLGEWAKAGARPGDPGAGRRALGCSTPRLTRFAKPGSAQKGRHGGGKRLPAPRGRTFGCNVKIGISVFLFRRAIRIF
jgi:hypothetical protein